MTKNDLQRAITEAAETSMGAVASKAFERTAAGWKVRPKCLTEYYSSGEKIVCGVLLCVYWELYGSSNGAVIPDDAKYENHPVDLVWPGGFYFLKALDNLSDETAWSAIRMLLPGGN